MKSTVRTRIFISLTPEEARDAVNDAIDMQLCVRSALYQIDGMPVSTLVEQNNHRKQIAAPAARNGRAKAKPARRAKPGATATAAKVECPECHEMFKPRGLNVHIARKHPLSATPLSATPKPGDVAHAPIASAA